MNKKLLPRSWIALSAWIGQRYFMLLKPILSDFESITKAELQFERSLMDSDFPSNIELPGAISEAHPSRKWKFYLGRLCVQAAFDHLQHDCRHPIEVGPNGAPLWPQDFCGSLTHTAGYAACIVASKKDYESLGNDAEVWAKPEVVLRMRTRVNHEDEYSHLSFLDDRQAFSLLFSCKESLWKLFNQWNGSSPGFLDFVLEERIAAEHCLLFRCHIFGQSESIKQKVHYELFEWGVETWCGLRVQS